LAAYGTTACCAPCGLTACFGAYGAAATVGCCWALMWSALTAPSAPPAVATERMMSNGELASSLPSAALVPIRDAKRLLPGWPEAADQSLWAVVAPLSSACAHDAVPIAKPAAPSMPAAAAEAPISDARGCLRAKLLVVLRRFTFARWKVDEDRRE
jgi:hypothetical protein